MAQAAIEDGSSAYSQKHFIIRSRIYSNLRKGSMAIGTLAKDDRLKLFLPQVCSYCASAHQLAADHLIPLNLGGPDVGDNLVWACRSCNSSKRNLDMIEWLRKQNRFPTILLLRRYLKLAIQICIAKGIMDLEVENAPELPFSLSAIPLKFPPPLELKLWILEIPR